MKNLLFLAAFLFAFLFAYDALGKVIELTNPNQVANELGKPGPRVLLYSAPWCGFCTEFHPTYEKLSDEMIDVRFYQMNVDNIELKEHRPIVTGVPMAFVAKDEKSLRQKPCAILNGKRDPKTVEAEIRQCLK